MKIEDFLNIVSGRDNDMTTEEKKIETKSRLECEQIAIALGFTGQWAVKHAKNVDELPAILETVFQTYKAHLMKREREVETLARRLIDENAQ